MAANSKVIALLSATLTLGTAAGLAALAQARDAFDAASARLPIVCEPGSCSIVVKTETGGAPSPVHNLPAAQSRPVWSPVLVASLPGMIGPSSGR